MNDPASTAAGDPRLDSPAELQAWLLRELAAVLEVEAPSLSPQESFSRYGLDSAKAVRIINRLGALLGRRLAPTLMWSHPTAESLAAHLSGAAESTVPTLPVAAAPLVATEPIAIVGVACRFPGAPDPAAFWELLRHGRSGIAEIPRSRWDMAEYYDPDLSAPGKMNAKWAGLIERVDEFDPGFFGISPREAVQMDPQQRLALELAWEALDDAGLRPHSLRGSRTGVFVGVVWHDYETLARQGGAEITIHSGTGQSFSIVANRISYALGLQGPSLALDTACSSSLMTVHLACQSLRSGESTVALAGGVNLILAPDTMVALTKFGGLSPTGVLRAFDAGADGFVRGEGGGFVVLKPLRRALADGDPIYCVIRGSAANNDGPSNGLTAPNPQAQEAVLVSACAAAGVTPGDVQYVEAHGTGTPLGDPIEASALGVVFGRARSAEHPLLVGSVKTNLGHLEGAAGIAGLIKVALALRRRELPPSLNFVTPNPHIDFAGARLRVVTAQQAWPEPDRRATAGVSAFGWGGTNCHVVLQEFPASTAQLVPLAAPSPAALRQLAGEFKNFVHTDSSARPWPQFSALAAARFSTGPHRVALTARSAAELETQLDSFLADRKTPGVAVGEVAGERGRRVLVFSPQGSQWLGMACGWMRTEPAFRARLATCDAVFRPLTGWSIFDELTASPAASRLGRAEIVQPVLFSVQVALAALWRAWGIEPDFIVGHSLGEWAAACVAGALSLEDAARVVFESSRLQARMADQGAMAVVELAAADVAARIEAAHAPISLTGFNSPTSTILAGDPAALKSLVEQWKQEGVLCSLIDVNVAAHSPAMDGLLAELQAALAGIRPCRTAVPLISSVTGGVVRGETLNGEFWAQHLRQPVQFAKAAALAVQLGGREFLEVSPHPLLLGAVGQILKHANTDGVALASGRRGADERAALLDSAGALFALGAPVKWEAVAPGGGGEIKLPVALEALAARPDATPPTHPELLPLSAHTPAALRDLARSVAAQVRAGGDSALPDLCYTAAVRRSHHEFRLATLTRSATELADQLEAFARGEEPPAVLTGRRPAAGAPKVAFVFSGQGPQWWGMGRELLGTEEVFRAELARCSDLMTRHVSWDLLAELTADEKNSRLDQTEIAQPALFALQVAQVALWRSWGVVPAAVVGHSIGEVAAAHVAGVLTLEDAVRVVCHRGRIMQRATGLGKMAAIELPLAEAEALVARHPDKISIAAVNSPTSTVLSGDAAIIESLTAELKARGVPGKVLPVNYAFHSPQMEPFVAELVAALDGLSLRAPTIPIYSTVTGQPAAADDFGATYWGRNVRQPVRFAAAIGGLLERGTELFVELSPEPVLASMILRCASAMPTPAPSQVLPSLRRGQPERSTLLTSVSKLYVAGAGVDWQNISGAAGPSRLLPVYPWQRKRHWLETTQAVGVKPNGRRNSPASGSLGRLWPGKRLAAALPVFETEVSLMRLSCLNDHRVGPVAILPATFYLDLALAGATRALNSQRVRLENVVLGEALALDQTDVTPLQLLLTEPASGPSEFQIFSGQMPADANEWVWRLHCRGLVVPDGPSAGAPERFDAPTARARCGQQLSSDQFYAELRERGLEFGSAFRTVERVWRNPTEALGQVHLSAADAAADRGPQGDVPRLLDGCLQVFLALCLGRSPAAAGPTAFVAVGVRHYQIFRDPGAVLWAHANFASGQAESPGQTEGDVRVWSEAGELVAEIRGLQVRQVAIACLDALTPDAPDSWFYETRWQLKSLPSKTDIGWDWQPADLGARLSPLLKELGLRQNFEPSASIYSKIESLSAAYVVEALVHLGLPFNPGESFETNELAARLRVVPRHHRLLQRLLEMLGEDGVLRETHGRWTIGQRPPPTALSGRIDALAAAHPDCEIELGLLARCGSQLAGVLRGEGDPLQLLFPADDRASAERLYRDSAWSRVYNSLVAEAVAAALESFPADRIVRILEIGAGTGGTTAYVLDRLPAGRAEYVFTDVSKFLLHQAAEKFGSHPFLRRQLLDIETDPVAQGFVPRDFDIVFAANALHATKDLRQTLAHVHQLLAPGGLFLLLETTAPRRWVDLTFGLTEGWWRFTDAPLRTKHPLLGPGKWLELLEDSGFAGATAVGEPQSGLGVFEQHLFLARGSEPTPAEIPVARIASEGWLIFADPGDLGRDLKSAVESRGFAGRLVRPGKSFTDSQQGQVTIDPANDDEYRRLVAGVVAGGVTTLRVIYVCGWDADNEDDLLENTVQSCNRLLQLLRALNAASNLPAVKLWVLTRGAHAVGDASGPVAVAQAPLWGLGRSIALEHPSLWGGLLDLDPAGVSVSEASRILDEISAPDGEDQIAWRGEARQVLRLAPRTQPLPKMRVDAVVDSSRAQRLDVSARGDLENLRLIPVPRPAPGAHEVEIQVRAAALNFKDVLNAMGLYPGDPGALGLECAGVVTRCGAEVRLVKTGDLVVALADGSFADYVTTRADYTAPKPAALGFEDAATLPVAFLTAHFALIHLAKISAGDRVLIHSGAGGVGMAAIQLARAAGAEIFATAGSAEKRARLQALGVPHVFDSRSVAFAAEIHRLTGGAGVDVVLNSLSGEALAKTFEATARGGRFIEIGKRGIWSPERVASLGRDLRYHVVDLAADLRNEPSVIAPLFQAVIAAVAQGKLAPLPKTSFPMRAAAKAFQFMAQARQVGKIVLVNDTAGRPDAGAAPREFVIRPDASYLITGALGALGLRLARWLVEQGARSLILAGRTPLPDRSTWNSLTPGSETHERASAVQALEQLGARVRVVGLEVARRDEVAALLEDIRTDAPALRGVFHLAGYSAFQSLATVDAAALRASFSAKILGAWNLHGATREQPLDCFVLFSSLTSLLGAKDLAPYAAANAFLDALAQHRQALQLPGLSVNWGAWEVIRLLKAEDSKSVERFGLRAMRATRALAAMGRLIAARVPQQIVADVDWSILQPAFELHGRRPLFAELKSRPTSAPATDPASGETSEKSNLLETLARTPSEERRAVVADFVSREVRRVLALEPADALDPARGLVELGLDSLMAVQLRGRLQAGVDQPLSATLTFNHPTVTALTKFLCNQVLKLDTAPAGPGPQPAAKSGALEAEMAGLADDEVRQLLADELATLSADLRE